MLPTPSLAPAPALDLSLFQQTSHNPSYASLTNDFALAGQLHDYCIPVNSYFPPANVMAQSTLR